MASCDGSVASKRSASPSPCCCSTSAAPDEELELDDELLVLLELLLLLPLDGLPSLHIGIASLQQDASSIPSWLCFIVANIDLTWLWDWAGRSL